jgi:6-pyruvoyltetrahydropterin/6-carboxytetrahydropterin synthase
LKLLKRIIRESVVQKVDHKNLNTDVDFLQGVIPTSENLAMAFWDQLIEKIPVGRLYAVKVFETEKNCAEYKG